MRHLFYAYLPHPEAGNGEDWLLLVTDNHAWELSSLRVEKSSAALQDDAESRQICMHLSALSSGFLGASGPPISRVQRRTALPEAVLALSGPDVLHDVSVGVDLRVIVTHIHTYTHRDTTVLC